MANVIFNRYRDNSAVWVRVSHQELIEAKFQDSVKSPRSRINLGWVYLADEDMQLFLEAAQSVWNRVEVREMPPVQKSTIVNLAPYRKGYLLFVPVPGRVIKIGDKAWQILGLIKRGSGRIYLKRVA